MKTIDVSSAGLKVYRKRTAKQFKGWLISRKKSHNKFARKESKEDAETLPKIDRTTQAVFVGLIKNLCW